VIGSTVQVGPRLYTEVRKGRFPTAPQRIDDARLQQYLDGLDIVGTGRRDGLNVFHPATIGRLLAATDLPKGPLGKAPGLAAGAPQMFLADTVSADVYTNTQPLLQYRQLIGGAGTGSVKVGVGF